MMNDRIFQWREQSHRCFRCETTSRKDHEDGHLDEPNAAAMQEPSEAADVMSIRNMKISIWSGKERM